MCLRQVPHLPHPSPGPDTSWQKERTLITLLFFVLLLLKLWITHFQSNPHNGGAWLYRDSYGDSFGHQNIPLVRLKGPLRASSSTFYVQWEKLKPRDGREGKVPQVTQGQGYSPELMTLHLVLFLQFAIRKGL